MVVMIKRPNLTYASAIVAGTGLIAAWWLWERRRRELLPEKWRKVGEIVDILCYPIKSVGPVRLDSAECTQLGLKSGWLRDRTLMVTDLDGKCVTARQHPKMVKISPSFKNSVLTLEAPDMEPISIDLAQLLDKRVNASVWNDNVTVCDCGDQVANWLSRFILQEDTGLRLVYYPLETTMRPIGKTNQNFPLVKAIDSGAFSDETSFSMQNLSSIDELNSRLENPVSDRNFRMNFSVKGAKAFEEDTWDWVKVGNVVFRNVMPCRRCLFTTINPQTGNKSPIIEPIKTLRTFRKVNDTRYKPIVHESPLMGIHLGLRSSNGIVRVGDSIYVNEETQQVPIVPAFAN